MDSSKGLNEPKAVLNTQKLIGKGRLKRNKKESQSLKFHQSKSHSDKGDSE